MVHIVFLTNNVKRFEKHFKAFTQIIGKNRVIILCDTNIKEDIAEVANRIINNSLVISKEAVGEEIGRITKETSYEQLLKGKISGKRNAALLMSSLINLNSDVIFFDDDTYPMENPVKQHVNLLKRFYLSQGKYSGKRANGLYIMLELFDEYYCISKKQKNEMNIEKVDNLLAGISSDSKFTGVIGAVGGNMGISSILKLSLPFIPCDWRIEDHFYEFNARLKFGEGYFMNNNNVREDEIPIVVHDRSKGDLNTLFRQVKEELEGGIIELALIKNMLGQPFDFDDIKKEMWIRSAIPKFQKAAGIYLNNSIIASHKPSKEFLNNILDLKPEVNEQDFLNEKEAYANSVRIFRKITKVLLKK